MKSKTVKTKRNLNIGFLFAFSTRDSMIGEGIFHLISYIIRNTLAIGEVNISICCFSWMKDIFSSGLEQLGIGAESVNYTLSDKKTPYIYKQYLKSLEKKKTQKITVKEKIRLFLRHLQTNVGEFVIAYIVNVRGIFQLLPFVLLVFAIPLSVICFVLFFFVFSIVRFGTWIINRKIVQAMLGIVKMPFQKVIALKNVFFDRLLDAETRRLVRACNQSSLDILYVTSPLTPLIKSIKALKIVAVHDAVYLDFPSMFVDASGERFVKKMHNDYIETLKYADAAISYSDYVIQNHAIPYLGKREALTRVIPHANIDLAKYLENGIVQTGMDMREFALETLQDYVQNVMHESTDIHREYIRHYDWRNADFLFVSSQIRPHKNIMNLLRAFKVMLREHYRNIKIITTGNLYINEITKSYLEEHCLQFDVLCLGRVPSDVHATLYKLATLSVAPTLFEGGFTGCFSEALSVGVPAVISDIPVTQEYFDDSDLDREIYEKAVFDPYNVNDIVAKIEWALDHRSELLELEMKKYNKMASRTWEIVAGDYLDFFKEIYSQKSNVKRG